MTGVAILGAGIFATKAHLPAIESLSPTLNLLAVYSRSEKSALDLASACQTFSPSIYYDSPSSPSRSLDALLTRSDITAVIIVLPILLQPAIIRKALLAGKHVLSEKPIAKDIASAEELMSWYSSLSLPNFPSPSGKPLWAVAENFRFIDALEFAASELAKIGGKVTTFKLSRHGYVPETDKFFNTPWRKAPEYQGGFLLDGGVHFIAGLRMLLSAVGEEITKVVGFSGLLEERLVPVDTVDAVAMVGGGRTGVISMSFGTEFKKGLEVEVVTTKGAVSMSESWPVRLVKVVKGGERGEKVEEVKEFEFRTAVAEELKAWAEALEKGKLEERQSPEEALKDLAILQRLLESGEKVGEVKSC